MKAVFAVLGGFATAFGFAWLFQNRQTVRDFAQGAVDTASNVVDDIQQLSEIDLNECSREDLIEIGLTDDDADRVLENRPYRNKLDLVSRLVVAEGVYETMKHAVSVDPRSANEPVKVAS